MDPPPPPISVDIISDDEISAFSPSPIRFPLKKPKSNAVNIGGPPTFLIIDDDPTPQKPNLNPVLDRTPSFVAETPLSYDVSVVKCSLGRSPTKFAGITSCICLESDNESEDGSFRGRLMTQGCAPSNFGLVGCSQKDSSLSNSLSPIGSPSANDCNQVCSPLKQSSSANILEVTARNLSNKAAGGCSGTSNIIQSLEDNPVDSSMADDDLCQVRSYYGEDASKYAKLDSTAKRKRKPVSSDSNNCNNKNEVAARNMQQKEEKARIAEERKRKRQEEKLQREALKAETAERKKLEKEKQKWEKGKLAVKSIIAVIDAKVVENGSVGGHLLTRLAEKGLSFRITSNPIERSILWQMSVPDQIAQISSAGSEVPYVLLVYQAEEFCELVRNESLFDHIRKVQSCYPSFTVCCLTNKLMSYINKCEQNQYKNLSNTLWRRPPVEEVLSQFITHFTKVHSRQCTDEAELAEHIVGLTSSLANCQFRKKLTQLSVNANGSVVPNDFIDKNVIKKNVWLKALVAIPKVQPRYAIAIWKKYPTMRSLLNVYMDPNRTVHEKEFLLKDLMIEGLLGKEDRRLGEVCSKRIYRILMAQSGGIKTDDVEDGADLFGL